MAKAAHNCLGKLTLAGCCALLCLPAAAAQTQAPLMSTPQAVRDLHYGDALFYFFQDDYFRALVRLDAARKLERIPHHEVEGELLVGALYLSLGQHQEAGRIFQALLNDNVSITVRNRAWFYLAKLWYQRNYFAEAESALGQIQGELAEGLEQQRRMLYAQVLMNQDRFDEAIRLLETWQFGEDWGAYARFNLGVALVRQQRSAEGVKLLDAVGSMEAPDTELKALRDKANLALGFTWIKDGKFAEAKQVLQRVRLEGPQSNKALLGLGWADSNATQYNRALVPWLELKERNLLDAAVQEAYLAIPYAYAQLAAQGQAADAYAFAIESFRTESARIDESIAAIRGGGLLTALLDANDDAQFGWHARMKNLPDAPESRYLYHLMASHTFQEALKNYRDLEIMQRNLDQWQSSVAAFGDMMDTRRLAYAQRSDALTRATRDVNIDAIEGKVLELSARIEAVERDQDVAALATPRDQALWRKVQDIDAALAQRTGDPATEEMRDKARLVRGVLYWDFNANFKARLWHQKKEMRELEVAAKESRRRWTLLDRARDDYPQRTEEFGTRVAALAPKLEQLLAACRQAGQTQARYLADVAIRELESQKQRLAQYSLQAQFALASIYDRAADGVTGKTQEMAP